MTLTKPYEATFKIGNGEEKAFSFLFDEVSENFIKVIVKRADGSIYIPTFSVDMDLKQVVFGEDEITPTPDDIICIYRDTPTIQDTQFNTLQGYNAKALENILSKIVAMIQEMKANGFSTQILQGEPWSLDLIKPADDGASVQIDYQARVLKKGLYFKMSDGNLQASANGVDFVQMPKSAEVKEFRHRVDNDGNVHFEYRIDKDWIGLRGTAETYDKSYIDNQVMRINAEIDANTTAIQKTREDYIAADSEIHKTLNGHTAELTTLRGNQASLGVQVSNIEHKIPESASGSNPLTTKQQLATKQDQLTAGDNIIISGNVISATGAGGGAGFDIVVVQELPATGQKGTIYLLAKDGTAPDVYDEYVWITATQTFELIGSTKVDLSDYVKKSGDTMSGGLTLPELTVRTAEGEFYVSVVAGVVTIATNNGLDFASHVKFDHAPTTDDNTTYADALDTSMVRKAQVATAIADAVNNIDALPDQTGNAGKVLTTDGTTASWQEPAGGTKVIFREWEE